MLGADIARSTAGDRSVVCIVRGAVCTDFRSWRSADLEITSGRIIEIARDIGIRKTMVAPNHRIENGLMQTEIGQLLLESQPGSPDDAIPHARKTIIRN